MSELRVYLVTPAFLPEIGGQEIHLHELSEALIAQGASVRVVTRQLEAAYPPHENVGTVPVMRLSPIGESKGAGWRAVPMLALFLGKVLYRLLKDRREYDVVLVSGFNVLPLAAVIACGVTRKPCVVRPESPMELQEAVGGESQKKMGLAQNSLVMSFFLGLRHWAAKRVDRYVAISSQIKQGLLAMGVPEGKIVRIPNGINTDKFAPPNAMHRRELRERLGLPLQAQILIYTGRLATSKGVMMLIRIWQELSAQFPGTHLVMAGTGSGSIDNCEDELRAYIAANHLADRVTLPGNVANVSEYLQASDVFAFPSDYEGFGLSIIEAMAVGLPMVSTRVGVAAEAAGSYQDDLLVPPNDPLAFTQALQRLLGDVALQAQIRARAQHEVRTQYSMSAVAGRHLEVLAELAGCDPLRATRAAAHVD